MSQFLDCFSPDQIVTMLGNVAQVMKPGARLCIMELFWDAQKFEAASFSLNATSLYFTCMANGNSRFYSAEKFYHYGAGGFPRRATTGQFRVRAYLADLSEKRTINSVKYLTADAVI